jgi:hypothetical protein
VKATRRFGVPFTSILLVVGILVLLAYLPGWVRKTQFTFSPDVSKAPAPERPSFAMDRPF